MPSKRGRVAQLDRAIASGAIGRGFESRSAHHEKCKGCNQKVAALIYVIKKILVTGVF